VLQIKCFSDLSVFPIKKVFVQTNHIFFHKPMTINQRKTIKRPSPEFLGYLAVLSSAFFFYFSTVVIRWAKPYAEIDPALFVFTRLLFGFFIACGILIFTGKDLKPKKYGLLLGRTLSNCVAVYCFYQGVTKTSVAEANILNMTYPVFVALFSWFFFKHQRDLITVGLVLVAFFGIWLVLSPGKIGLNLNNLWGLASGVSATFAIIILNVSRRFHDTNTILFYMFGLGSIFIYILFYDRFLLPSTTGLYFLFLCAALGVGGQYLLTVGFLFVTSVEAGIISSTRILLAAILGPLIASDPPLTLIGWLGALLIFTANIFLALRRSDTQ
jgi:drug/metabolite transporter (DMT)-like permease